jgi:hypothetical protein
MTKNLHHTWRFFFVIKFRPRESLVSKSLASMDGPPKANQALARGTAEVYLETDITAVWRRGQLHINWFEKWMFNTIQWHFTPSNGKVPNSSDSGSPPVVYNPISLTFCAKF